MGDQTKAQGSADRAEEKGWKPSLRLGIQVLESAKAAIAAAFPPDSDNPSSAVDTALAAMRLEVEERFAEREAQEAELRLTSTEVSDMLEAQAEAQAEAADLNAAVDGLCEELNQSETELAQWRHEASRCCAGFVPTKVPDEEVRPSILREIREGLQGLTKSRDANLTHATELRAELERLRKRLFEIRYAAEHAANPRPGETVAQSMERSLLSIRELAQGIKPQPQEASEGQGETDA